MAEELTGHGFYVTIPMALVQDETISNGAKIAYGVIANLCNQRGYCFATNGYISNVLGSHETTASKYISELIKSGYLVPFEHVTENGSQRRLKLGETTNPPLVKTLRPPRRKHLPPLGENAKQNKQILNNKYNIGAAPSIEDFLTCNPTGRFILIHDSTKVTIKVFEQSFEQYLNGTFGPAYDGQKITIKKPPPIEAFFEARNGDLFNSNQHVWSSFKKLWINGHEGKEEQKNRYKIQ